MNLARRSIDYYLKNEQYLVESGVDEGVLTLPLATFVTLEKDGELRGCIGRLEPVQELYKDIIENAVAAAFFDERFTELSSEEMDQIVIEISILTPTRTLVYTSADDLLNKLESHPGVVLTKNGYSATFLPQVWESVSDSKDFLEQLSLKAGLSRNGWKDANFKVYDVIKFSERSN